MKKQPQKTRRTATKHGRKGGNAKRTKDKLLTTKWDSAEEGESTIKDEDSECGSDSDNE